MYIPADRYRMVVGLKIGANPLRRDRQRKILEVLKSTSRSWSIEVVDRDFRSLWYMPFSCPHIGRCHAIDSPHVSGGALRTNSREDLPQRSPKPGPFGFTSNAPTQSSKTPHYHNPHQHQRNDPFHARVHTQLPNHNPTSHQQFHHSAQLRLQYQHLRA